MALSARACSFLAFCQSTGPRVIFVCSGNISNTFASILLRAGCFINPATISPFRNELQIHLQNFLHFPFFFNLLFTEKLYFTFSNIRLSKRILLVIGVCYCVCLGLRGNFATNKLFVWWDIDCLCCPLLNLFC